MQMIRLLTTADVSEFKKLRIKSLITDPLSWHSSFEEENDKPIIFFENKLRYAISGAIFGYYGYFDKNRLIAYAQFADSFYNKKKHITYLYDVLVEPDARKLGVGKKLIEYIISKAKEVGFIEQIHLKVNSKNENAINFYERLKFEKITTIPKAVKEKDGTYQDEYEYVLYL